MELQKTLEMDGILGEQVFKAMDSDNDGVITCEKFTNFILTLSEGTEEAKFRVIFDILDFNKKGFVSFEDLKAIGMALPTNCLKCGQQISRSWHLDRELVDLFGGKSTYSCESLWETRASHEEIFADITAAVASSLPAVVFDILGVDNKAVCSESGCPAYGASPEFGSFPLTYEGRKYFFTLRAGCLWGYVSLTAALPKVLILTKGLFVVPVDLLSFELRNCTAVYHFTAASQAIREQWMEWVNAEKHYRWFDDYYETGDLLGLGGQGMVFRATSRGCEQLAAVKIVSKEGLTPKNEARIRNEISVLRLANHPNILRLYDIFETSERFYLVTELLREGTLFTWLENQHFPSCESFAKTVVTDLATGLLYLHSHNVIHRDLKLENIMLRKGAGGHVEAVLIDFGLACYAGPEQFSIEPVGTLKYAAPELLSRLPYGEKVDCWSLGVILYVMLAGRMPFYGKNDQDVAVKILKRRVNCSGEKWQSVSLAAKAVVYGLLSRKVESRWSAREVLSSEWLCGEPEEAGSPGTEGVPQIPLREEVLQGEVVY